MSTEPDAVQGEIVEHQETGRAVAQGEASPPPTNILALVERAITSGASMDMLEKLLDLQERHEQNEARKAYDKAIAAAKAEIPPILKTATVDYTTQKGRTHFKHETLDAIARVVDPILSKYGLSYRFRSKQDGATVSVTCIVAHRDGYSEETTLSGGPDQSGMKNAYQAVGSAATYLQRYTLKLALGLSAAKDTDSVGAGVDQPDPPATITAEQYTALKAKMDEAGVDASIICEAEQIAVVPELPAARFDGVMKRLQATIDRRGEAKRAANAAAAAEAQAAMDAEKGAGDSDG
jgi:hypothetical protein